MKRLTVLFVLMIILSSVFALKVALLLNGTLGDKSFMDSAASGLFKAEKELGVDGRIIEMYYDPTNWRPTLVDVSNQDYDVIIVGTFQLAAILKDVAPEHPDKKYILFDATMDYSKGAFENVYSVLYKQNEGSFLAGALAALLTQSNVKGINDKKIIGFIGGMDIPAIRDFLVGYEAGAKYIDPEVEIKIAFLGTFKDPARGKEAALTMFRYGVDVCFAVAGRAGLGVLEAAKERGAYAIGVDVDQAKALEEKDPQLASHIVTSMVKNVGLSLYRALERHLKGENIYGRVERLGIAEGGVGLAKNKYYNSIVPEDIKKKIEELEKALLAGKIKVPSFFEKR